MPNAMEEIAPADVYKRQVIYRTHMLKECGLELPKHTCYVDNIFVYYPLPYVKTLYYMDIDLYHYFIGRADQSVNEQVMIGRVDQQIKVNRIMIDQYDICLLYTSTCTSHDLCSVSGWPVPDTEYSVR